MPAIPRTTPLAELPHLERSCLPYGYTRLGAAGDTLHLPRGVAVPPAWRILSTACMGRCLVGAPRRCKLPYAVIDSPGDGANGAFLSRHQNRCLRVLTTTEAG